MKRMRNNGGFTLVELMVTILVGSIVTLSATTILLLGMRIMNKSNDTAEKQNTTRILLATLENLAVEGTITEVRELNDVEGNATGLQIYNGAQIVFSYDTENQTVYTGAGENRVELLTDVEDFSANISGKVLTFNIKPVDGEPYETSVYCRMTPYGPGSDNTGTSLIDRLTDADATNDSSLGISDSDRIEFLKILASQVYSVGIIKGGTDAGTYYSEWYLINQYNEGYADNPGWNENTPWCACYVSWALAQKNFFGATHTAPRYANVNSFMDYFRSDNDGMGSWIVHKEGEPTPGDLIFFNTDDDPQADHMGVVLAYTDEKVYTIEGNSYNKVRVRDYVLVDGHPDNADGIIMGYGVLNWTIENNS